MMGAVAGAPSSGRSGCWEMLLGGMTPFWWCGLHPSAAASARAEMEGTVQQMLLWRWRRTVLAAAQARVLQHQPAVRQVEMRALISTRVNETVGAEL